MFGNIRTIVNVQLSLSCYSEFETSVISMQCALQHGVKL